ncbi:MAG: hypothetical protein WDW38_003748 [Sanguina aurantia]
MCPSSSSPANGHPHCIWHPTLPRGSTAQPPPQLSLCHSQAGHMHHTQQAHRSHLVQAETLSFLPPISFQQQQPQPQQQQQQQQQQLNPPNPPAWRKSSSWPSSSRCSECALHPFWTPAPGSVGIREEPATPVFSCRVRAAAFHTHFCPFVDDFTSHLHTAQLGAFHSSGPSSGVGGSAATPVDAALQVGTSVATLIAHQTAVDAMAAAETSHSRSHLVAFLEDRCMPRSLTMLRLSAAPTAPAASQQEEMFPAVCPAMASAPPSLRQAVQEQDLHHSCRRLLLPGNLIQVQA